MTFEVRDQIYRQEQYGWKTQYEVFALCKSCAKPTIFVVSLGNIQYQQAFQENDSLVKCRVALNNFFEIDGFVSLRDNISIELPEHLPEAIERTFREGLSCLSIDCYNAAATMFRLCVDLVTQPLLPNLEGASGPSPNAKQRRDLGLRLQWLLDQGILAPALRELARCVHQDGNDGAHVGNLKKEDADDLLDFTRLLLERLITEPRNLELAEERRAARRAEIKK